MESPPPPNDKNNDINSNHSVNHQHVIRIADQKGGTNYQKLGAVAGAAQDTAQDGLRQPKPDPRITLVVPRWVTNFLFVERGWKHIFLSLAVAGFLGSILLAKCLPDPKSNPMASAIDPNQYDSPIPEIGLPPPEGITLPPILAHIKDFTESHESNDMPFFFHIPRSGGKTMMTVLGKCLGMVQASDVGGRDGRDQDPTLEVIETSTGSFVNVNTYTQEGIQRARGMGLVQSGKVDSITSPLIYDAAGLFPSDRRGRLFALFRHPISRANSYFNYISQADWDPHYSPKLANIPIETYAFTSEDRPEFNWLTKVLSNKLGSTDPLTENDLNVAKHFLKTKCLVGLLDEKGDSLLRFEKFFGWVFPDTASKTCEEELLHWQGSFQNSMSHDDILPGSEAWRLLTERNRYDMDLYEYAKRLFYEQGQIFYNPGQG